MEKYNQSLLEYKTELEGVWTRNTNETTICTFAMCDEPHAMQFNCGCLLCFDHVWPVLSAFCINGDDTCGNHSNQEKNANKKSKNYHLSQEVFNLVLQHGSQSLCTRFALLLDYVPLLKKMNFMLCRCNRLWKNTTGYAKQVCSTCNRELCFFCGEDWNSTRQNQLYSCTVSCKYTDYLNYEMVPWKKCSTPNTNIPSRRFCPNCGFIGGVDKCKMHTCQRCGHEFCFFCLKSRKDCLAQHHPKSFYDVCVNPPVAQKLADIWNVSINYT